MDHEELYYRAMEEVVHLEGSPQQKVALLGELLWRSIRQYIGRLCDLCVCVFLQSRD